jgi:hypothetical protein
VRNLPFRRKGRNIKVKLLLIHNLGTRWGCVFSVTLRPRFTPSTHCTGGWVGPTAGLGRDVRRKIILPLPEIEPRSPVRPVRNRTLYCLSYPAQGLHVRTLIYIYIYIYMGSRVISFSIVSDYGLDHRAIGVRSLAGAKDFSSSLFVQTGSEAHPPSCPIGARSKSRPERDADHSSPSSAVAVNE